MGADSSVLLVHAPPPIRISISSVPVPNTPCDAPSRAWLSAPEATKVPPVPVPGSYRSVLDCAVCTSDVSATQVDGNVPASTSTPPGRITSPAKPPALIRVAVTARLANMLLAVALQVWVPGSYTSAEVSVVATISPLLAGHTSLLASMPPNETRSPSDGIATSDASSRAVVRLPLVFEKVSVVGLKMNE